MFPRIKSYKNKDGSTRHYLFLVDNKRIGGKVRQVVRANFGRVENLDKVLPDIIEKLSKFSKKLKSGNIKADWVKEYGKGNSLAIKSVPQLSCRACSAR